MANPDEALATQLRNIEAKTGQGLPAIRAAIAASGKVKHGEVRSWLMETYALRYGDANSLAHFASGTKGPSATTVGVSDALSQIYSGKKELLREIHDTIVAEATSWGNFEVAPRKGYVAMRRKKQFAMLGPKTADRSELGINLKDDVASDRIIAQKTGGMCQYAVALNHTDDVDAELLAILRRAFDAAG